MSSLNFHILTLFPQMIEQACDHSILKRGSSSGLFTVDCVNIRDFAINKHGQVDDTPYGGGAGMLMMAPPIYDAFMSIQKPQSKFVYLSPHGKTFNQNMATELSKEEDIIMLCGHYEGVDRRVLDLLSPMEISLGDYILTGGELAALVVIDAVARLLPGVVGKNDSISNESFSTTLNGMLEYPQYTRPPVFKDMEVPSILLSGHHKQIDDWRKQQAFEQTKSKRPDLLELDNG